MWHVSICLGPTASCFFFIETVDIVGKSKQSMQINITLFCFKKIDTRGEQTHMEAVYEYILFCIKVAIYHGANCVFERHR